MRRRAPTSIELIAAMCIGKVAYDTMFAALEQLRKHRPGQRRLRRHAYRCKVCHKYHLGGH
jgi:hypothetical protein